jgi:NAD(P)-dependent dehydrogenase (short-subunit alcohol dehydrogenase family)
LVTGASSGIGNAIATHLASLGHRVYGTSRHPRAVPAPPGVEMIALDIDDDASVAAGIATLLAAPGHLDAVVNNAGWALMGAVEDTAIAEARAQMETNFFGVLRVCRAVLPIMRAQGGGHIVNISSLGGVFGMPFGGIYSASKFAVEGLSEALRLEARPFGIQVVLIETGDFQSELPAKRRIAAAAGGASAYRSVFERYKAKQAKDEAKARSPQPVARLVARILDDPAPKARYSVGMADQRMVLPLKRLLPGRLFERILRGALGV